MCQDIFSARGKLIILVMYFSSIMLCSLEYINGMRLPRNFRKSIFASMLLRSDSKRDRDRRRAESETKKRERATRTYDLVMHSEFGEVETCLDQPLRSFDSNQNANNDPTDELSTLPWHMIKKRGLYYPNKAP